MCVYIYIYIYGWWLTPRSELTSGMNQSHQAQETGWLIWNICGFPSFDPCSLTTEQRNSMLFDVSCWKRTEKVVKLCLRVGRWHSDVGALLDCVSNGSFSTMFDGEAMLGPPFWQVHASSIPLDPLPLSRTLRHWPVFQGRSQSTSTTTMTMCRKSLLCLNKRQGAQGVDDSHGFNAAP